MSEMSDQPSPGRLFALIVIGFGFLALGVAFMFKPGGFVPAPTRDFSTIPVEVNLPAPTLFLASLDGSPVSLSDYSGDVILVNLWATWCPPCRREMPMMTQLAATTPGADFVFANQGEDTAQIHRFLQVENLPATGMVRDPQHRLMAALDTVGLPATLVFDARAGLVVAHTGEISRAALTRMIAQATGE